MHRTHSALARALCVVALATLPQVACGASPSPTPPGRLAITEVSVLPMDREVVLEDQTVLIEGERITLVAPSAGVTVPPDTTVIDGRGRFLMPGLSDMHAHLRRKKGFGPEDYLDQGITVVRNMAGEQAHLDYRARLAAGEVSGPLLFTTGRPLTSSDRFPSHRKVTTAEEGRAAVREQAAAGYDFIKVYSLLSPEAFGGLAAEAAELGIPVVGHVSDQVGLRSALAAGISSIEHLFGYFWELEAEDSSLQGEWAPQRLFHAVEIDPAKLAPIAVLTAQAGAWNTPTLWRKNNYLTIPQAREAWETPALRALAETNRRLLVKALHDAGAGLLTGTDDEARILHDELELFVAAGLSPYEALAASTVDAARYLERSEEFGTVEVGRLANLLLLEANPLDDVRHTREIVGVVIRGAWRPRVEERGLGLPSTGPPRRSVEP